MTEYAWLQTCVGADYWEIHKMQDAAVEIDYDTVVEAVGLEELKRFFPDYGWDGGGDLRLQDDWHVSYRRSVYRGYSCVYVEHSGIEYIWIEEDQL